MSHLDPYEVYIEQSLMKNTIDIYVFKNNPDGSQDLYTNLNTMEIVRIEQFQQIQHDPTIRIHHSLKTIFLKAMANTLYEHGIKADQAPVLENELVAVKNHLEDMRSLVFKKPKLKEALR